MFKLSFILVIFKVESETKRKIVKFKRMNRIPDIIWDQDILWFNIY